jgi:hypothetical protein
MLTDISMTTLVRGGYGMRRRTTITVEERTWRRFRSVLALQGKDVSAVLEKLCEDYINENEAAARAEANRNEEEPDDGTL